MTEADVNVISEGAPSFNIAGEVTAYFEDPELYRLFKVGEVELRRNMFQLFGELTGRVL